MQGLGPFEKQNFILQISGFWMTYGAWGTVIVSARFSEGLGLTVPHHTQPLLWAVSWGLARPPDSRLSFLFPLPEYDEDAMLSSTCPASLVLTRLSHDLLNEGQDSACSPGPPLAIPPWSNPKPNTSPQCFPFQDLPGPSMSYRLIQTPQPGSTQGPSCSAAALSSQPLSCHFLTDPLCSDMLTTRPSNAPSRPFAPALPVLGNTPCPPLS